MRALKNRPSSSWRWVERLRWLLLQSAVLILVSPAAMAEGLPGIKRDFQFDAYMKQVDLENPTLEFIYKSGKHEGSSIGFHIAEAGRRKSASFIPYNMSNNLEAEVLSYRLARFLGISDIYTPITFYHLGPLAAGRFRNLLRKHSEGDPDRRTNYYNIVRELTKNPKTIMGTYRFRPKGQKYTVYAYGFGDHFNTGTRMGAVLRASGPMPTDKPISIPGVKGMRPHFPKTPIEKESEIARQLSSIMVVDMLVGQWDRFWRNLEATGDSQGRLALLARDNGGAEVDQGWEWFSAYESWVSRYDHDVIDKLRALNSFLQGKSKEFAGYGNVDKWKNDVGFLKLSSFRTFKRKLQIFIEQRLPRLEKQYKAQVFFAAKRPQYPEKDLFTGE